jgi:hypothetical protein
MHLDEPTIRKSTSQSVYRRRLSQAFGTGRIDGRIAFFDEDHVDPDSTRFSYLP